MEHDFLSIRSIYYGIFLSVFIVYRLLLGYLTVLSILLHVNVC